MKLILELLAMFSLRRIFNLLADLLKSSLIRTYINFIDKLRSIYLIGIITTLCLMLFLSGFLILHAAVFLALTWSLSSKITLLFILSGTYIFIPLVIFARLHSRKHWLERSGANKIIDDLNKRT